jgi:DNA topoisomerase IA
VYEFVVRHFLACCSKDAQGLETVVDIDIAGEKVNFYVMNFFNMIKV